MHARFHGRVDNFVEYLKKENKQQNAFFQL